MLPFQYFAPDLPQRRLGAYITVAGYETFGKGAAFPSVRHNSYYSPVGDAGRRLENGEYQILYIRSGGGVSEFPDGRRIALKAGSVNILRPGEWHRHRPDADTGWSEAYIGFGGELAGRVAKELFPGPEPAVLDFSDDPLLDGRIMTLVEQILSDYAERPHSLALQTLSLLASLAEDRCEGNDSAYGYMSIRRTCLYIAHHLDETLDLKELAGRSGMGYSLFRRRFRECTGLSPLAYQLSLRVWRAKRLLRETGDSIAEIAGALGFRSQAYFARFFRKAAGVSPSGWRSGQA